MNNNNNTIKQENFYNLSNKEKKKIIKELLMHEKLIRKVFNYDENNDREGNFKESLNYINYITSLKIFTEEESVTKHPRKRINNERDIICSMSLFIGDLSSYYIEEALDYENAYYKEETMTIIYVN